MRGMAVPDHSIHRTAAITMTRTLATLLLSPILAFAPAAATFAQLAPQLEPVDPALPAAETLLDQCVAALGGADALAGIESYRIEAECSQHEPAMLGIPERDYKGTGELLWHRSGHARLRGASETVDGQPASVWLRKLEFGVNPEFSWSRVPDRDREIFGRLQGTLDGTAPFDPIRILYLGIARHRDALLEPRTVKREQIGGKSCFKIMAKLRYKAGDTPRVSTIWLDPDTSRPMRCALGAVRTTYADWREVAGIQAPFKLTGGMFCGDHLNRFRSLAEVKVLTFNSVTPEEITAPANLRDMADVVADEMAVEAARRQNP